MSVLVDYDIINSNLAKESIKNTLNGKKSLSTLETVCAKIKLFTKGT